MGIMGTWYYQYAVEYYNDATGMCFSNGIVAGTNYEDALRRLKEFYGEDEIESLYMEALAAEGALVFEDINKKDKSFKEYLIKMDEIKYETY